MKSILAIAIVLTSTLSFASSYPPAIYGASLYCGENDGMVAMNLTDKKAWLAQWGSNSGIPLTNVKYQLARCFGCFALEAQYDNKTIKLVVRDNKVATGSIVSDRSSETLSFKCSQVNKKPAF